MATLASHGAGLSALDAFGDCEAAQVAHALAELREPLASARPRRTRPTSTSNAPLSARSASCCQGRQQQQQQQQQQQHLQQQQQQRQQQQQHLQQQQQQQHLQQQRQPRHSSRSGRGRFPRGEESPRRWRECRSADPMPTFGAGNEETFGEVNARYNRCLPAARRNSHFSYAAPPRSVDQPWRAPGPSVGLGSSSGSSATASAYWNASGAATARASGRTHACDRSQTPGSREVSRHDARKLRCSNHEVPISRPNEPIHASYSWSASAGVSATTSAPTAQLEEAHFGPSPAYTTASLAASAASVSSGSAFNSRIIQGAPGEIAAKHLQTAFNLADAATSPRRVRPTIEDPTTPRDAAAAATTAVLAAPPEAAILQPPPARPPQRRTSVSSLTGSARGDAGVQALKASGCHLAATLRQLALQVGEAAAAARSSESAFQTFRALLEEHFDIAPMTTMSTTKSERAQREIFQGTKTFDIFTPRTTESDVYPQSTMQSQRLTPKPSVTEREATPAAPNHDEFVLSRRVRLTQLREQWNDRLAATTAAVADLLSTTAPGTEGGGGGGGGGGVGAAAPKESLLQST